MKSKPRIRQLKLTAVGEKHRRFETLVAELVRANTFLHIFRGLWNSRADFELQPIEAGGFLHHTMSAQIGMALLQLCRVFDTHKDGINLLRFLNAVEPRYLPKAALPQLKTDLQLCGKDSNSRLVQKLRKWRNNIIAHYNYDEALDERRQFWIEHPWDNLDEVQALIDLGFTILDRYAGTHDQCPSSMRLAEGSNGYRSVLDALRKFKT